MHPCRTTAGVVALAATLAGAVAVPAAAPLDRSADAAGVAAAAARLDGPIRALVSWQGRLVAGGAFRSADGIALGSLAVWQGSRWSALGEPFDAPVHALVEFQGRLVAGGEFQRAGVTGARCVARWNDVAWEEVGGGTNGPVHALAASDFFLYAGGAFSHAGDVEAHGIARCYESEWSAVGAGADGVVRALVVDAGTLVAGGDFTLRDGSRWNHNLARFTGGAWHPLALGIDAPVWALALRGTDLVVGGAFTRIDHVTPARGVARLSGGRWAALGFGLERGEVRALGVDGDAWVVAGTFAQADLRPAAHVARFDGVNWSELGGGTDAPVEALTIWESGLVAGGSFAHAGGVAAPGVAVWCGGRWQVPSTTPVALAAPTLRASEHGVAITWRAAVEVARQLVAVAVQRAVSSDGPWRDLGSQPPGTVLEFVDTDADAGEPWYRITALDRDGGSFATPAVEWRQAPRFSTLTLVPGRRVDVDVALAVGGAVHLAVYDVRGRRIRTLADGARVAGNHRWEWRGDDTTGRTVARGCYFVRLVAPDGVLARTLVHAQR